jgi:hypothetical protein
MAAAPVPDGDTPVGITTTAFLYHFQQLFLR